MDSTAFQVIAICAIVAQALVIFLALFEPTLRYRIAEVPDRKLDDEGFVEMVATLVDAKLHRRSHVEVLTNGEVFYEAELAALREAQVSINLEAYIFAKGKVTGQFLDVLTERARAGVRVNMVLDAIGSFGTWDSYLERLREAGGRIAWYHPLRWHTLPRLNNRTHRELIIIDCRIGFVGGAGFADLWLYGRNGKPRWRDTMFRVEGEVVPCLQSTFVENWLEASGELLTGDEYFCFPKVVAESRMMVIDSAASSGQSTRARMLFQLLMASARKSIEITTPYFLPDHGVRAELIRAIRERGVRVRIVAPGKHNDHLIVRRSSRRLYGPLLEAGAEIFEYAPSMTHTKSMVIDGLWSVVGSTNFDHRSFSINDEVNLAACDAPLASRLQEDFERDVSASDRITLEAWRRRPWPERISEGFGRLLERQQ